MPMPNFEFIDPVIKQTGPFRGIGDLFNFIGMLVVGGFITLWFLRKIVKEIWEYVSDRLSTGRKDL